MTTDTTDTTDTTVHPFRIDVSDADLHDLHDRLARTRFPAPLPGQYRWVCNNDSSRSIRALVFAMDAESAPLRSGFDRWEL